VFSMIRKPNRAAAHSPAPQGAPLGVRRSLRLAGLSNTAAPAGADLVPAIINQSLSSPGHPLPHSERRFMEPRFGHNFAAVRVHDDATAAASAHAISANAFTIGRHVFFAQGQFRPGSRSGRRLLAHELAHVIQSNRDPSAAAAHASSMSLTI
jgi:hypothetical protein